MVSIQSWSIADFKSLGSADLTLAPLTVLAGANSSGKSSLLQSLLLLAQSTNRGGPLVMNGALVRLGEPRDVVREGQSAVELSFEVQMSHSALPPRTPNINVSMSLVPSPDATTLRPSSFEVIDGDGDLALAATSDRMKGADLDALNQRLPGFDTSFLRVTVLGGRRAPNRMYVGFLGLTPVLLARHIDPRTIENKTRQALTEAIHQDRLAYELSRELAQLVPKADFLHQNGYISQPERSTGVPLSRSFWTKREIGGLSSEHLGELIDAASKKRAEDDWAVVGPGFGYLGVSNRIGRRSYHEGGLIESHLSDEYAVDLQYLTSAAVAIEEFGTSIRYLGPLREEPRVVQGAWDERVDALPVGIRGELTAEVLTREKDRRISFRDWDDQPRQESLPDAVALWCDYFEMGDKITVLDLGKLGRGITLRVNGADRDLTRIGVGASQLLPILVACLAVARGSIVLIEQPELHLHPSVQSRLADFFAFARPDVRFIVETHSEYLITRLRRRIAERRIQPASVQVMFAERRSGATVVRTLPLSNGGDFDEWPVGFFDAQETDTRYIVRAVADRLTKERL
ncbi:AAA family ATPase [Microbacterium sp. 2216-1]|uniref:AAA family ATPase n=1 Tax=Microbacterium sp. 2216-1 TaxID=3390053 RepID=UPI003974CC97